MFSSGSKAVWRQLVAEVGGEFIEGGLLGSDSVRAKFKQWTIFLDTYSESGRDTVYTRFIVPYQSLDGATWRIKRKGMESWIANLPGLRQLGKLFAPPEIEVGDPDFQREFIINGTNSEKMVSMLAKQEIRRLIHRLQDPYFVATARDYQSGPRELRLYFQAPGMVEDLQQLKSVFELFEVTLDQLVAIGSASEEAPETER